MVWYGVWYGVWYWYDMIWCMVLYGVVFSALYFIPLSCTVLHLYGMVWYGAWYGMGHGMVWGMVWHGMGHGIVLLSSLLKLNSLAVTITELARMKSMVWYGMVWYGMVWYSFILTLCICSVLHLKSLEIFLEMLVSVSTVFFRKLLRDRFPQLISEFFAVFNRLLVVHSPIFME
jgi:hypothetical protein